MMLVMKALRQWVSMGRVCAAPGRRDFSLPASIRVPGSHRGLSSRRTRKALSARHRTKKMCIFIFEESPYFPFATMYIYIYEEKLRSHRSRICYARIDWSGGRQRRHCEITSRCRTCTRRCESVRLKRKSMGHFSSNILLSFSSIKLRRSFLLLCIVRSK